MSTLIIEIKAGERLIIEGVLINFETKARIHLLTKPTRFLFGKQIMRAEDATTPLRRLRYAIQQAYVGPVDTRRDELMRAVLLAEAISPEAVAAVDLAREDKFYDAIKAVRGLALADESRLEIGAAA